MTLPSSDDTAAAELAGRRLLPVDRYQVDVRTAGPDPAVGGPEPAVVLVHGIGVSGDYFLPFARVLARRRRVHLLDLPGYGRTPRPPRALGVPELADVVARTVALLSPEPVVLVGQSMGCQVVASAVAADPDAYAGYLLIGPTVDADDRSLHGQALRLARDMLRETPANNALVLRDYLRMGPVRYLHTARSMLADRIEDHVAACRAPGLVVRGVRDPIAPAGWVRRLADLAPDAAVVEVAGAAHNAQHTHPEELTDACTPFLARLARI